MIFCFYDRRKIFVVVKGGKDIKGRGLPKWKKFKKPTGLLYSWAPLNSTYKGHGVRRGEVSQGLGMNSSLIVQSWRQKGM